MSTPGERCDAQARDAGVYLANQAREAETTLMERVRYVIEHGAERPDQSLVDTEVMACDYVVYAIGELVREAMLGDVAVRAFADTTGFDYPASIRDGVSDALDTVLP